MTILKFTYRPDGDLSEKIYNEEVERLLTLARDYTESRELEKSRYIIQLIASELGLSADNDQDQDKIVQHYEANQEKYDVIADNANSDYIIERNENRETIYHCKKEKCRIVLTKKLVASKPIYEADVFGGLSNDRYEGYIVYER